MGDLAGKKRYAIDDTMKAALQQRYFAGCVDENGVREEIRRTWAGKPLSDGHPHRCGQRRSARISGADGDTRQSVIVSTASPYNVRRVRFGGCRRAESLRWLDDFACCRALAELTGTREPAQILALPDLPIRHTAVCEKDKMAQAVLDAVK